MAANPVIYEVNLSIARPRGAEFDAWLRAHVQDMLALPGFVDAQTLAVESDDPDALGRTVQYRLVDRAALDHYFEEHAETMRADGAQRFGDDLSATRRILSETTGDAAEAECSNCARDLTGQYCSYCGQRHRTRMISVWELLRAAFDDVFSWDSRVWRSLRPLLLSPGKLTAEYLAGRRVHYTPPLRMYLVLSIAFFVLSQLPALEDFQAANMLGLNENDSSIELSFSNDNRDAMRDASERLRTGADTPPDEANDQTPDETRDVQLADDTSDDEVPQANEDDDEGDPCDFETVEVNVPGVSPEAADQRLRQMCRRMMSDQGRVQFAQAFGDLAPKLLIVFLPVIALIGKLIYPLSRRYYVEHLLFYTHLHSFIFLLLIVLMFTSAAAPHVPFLGIGVPYLRIGAMLYAVYYIYRSLRTVFDQGRAMTLFKMFLIWMAYMIGSAILLTIGAAIAALSL